MYCVSGVFDDNWGICQNKHSGKLHFENLFGKKKLKFWFFYDSSNSSTLVLNSILVAYYSSFKLKALQIGRLILYLLHMYYIPVIGLPHLDIAKQCWYIGKIYYAW